MGVDARSPADRPPLFRGSTPDHPAEVGTGEQAHPPEVGPATLAAARVVAFD